MNENMPAISIITIVKNNEKLISRAIDSVFGQTFDDYEYILINDGSTDQTGKIIDSYAKKNLRIKDIHNQKNIGRAGARNIGLDIASGKYIFFLDSDDYLPYNAIKDLYDIAEKYEAEIVFGGIKCFDNIMGFLKRQHYTDKIINKKKHNFRLDEHLLLVNNHHIVGRLYRHELLKKNNIRFNEIRKNGEDIPFAFYTAFYAKRISMVPKIIGYYYYIGNYIGTANESKISDARDNILETIEFAEKYGNEELIETMWKKGAIFASSLERAEKVYKGQPYKMISYIESLAPLVRGFANEFTNNFTEYQIKYLNSLKSGEYKKAYEIWSQEYKSISNNTSGIDAEINIPEELKNMGIDGLKRKLESLKSENKRLAYQLDDIYNSQCWMLTSIFRRGLSIIRRS